MWSNGKLTDTIPVEIGSISREIFVSASDLVSLLKISDGRKAGYGFFS
jgi:hypothetical protein